MLLMIIFGLVAILGVFGVISSLKGKNILGIIFAGGSALVFGWFTIMTLVHNGFPVSH